MKLAVLSLVSVGIVSATPLLESRQAGGAFSGLFSGALSQLQPFKIEDVKPDIPIANAKRTHIWFGPFTIKAANSTKNPGNGISLDPSGTAYNYGIDILNDVTLLAGDMQAFNEDGSQVGVSNGIYIHHLATFDTSIRKPQVTTCANKSPSLAMQQGSAIFGGVEGKANTSNAFYTLPDGSMNAGSYLSPEDQLILNVDLVNYLNEERIVTVRIDATYIEKSVPGFMETSTYTVPIGVCNSSSSAAINAPEGTTKFSLQSDNIIINQDGIIFEVSGHMHDGGVNLRSKINGIELCDARALYDSDSTFMGGQGELGDWTTISEMVTCMKPLKVSKGDILTFEAHYDLEKHPARKHVMGGMAEEMALLTFFFAN